MLGAPPPNMPKEKGGGFLGLNNKQKSISGDSGKKQLFFIII
jgi:hypothetical protein